MEESQKLYDEAESEGRQLTDSQIDNLAMQRANDRFADMIDNAKDRAKYE